MRVSETVGNAARQAEEDLKSVLSLIEALLAEAEAETAERRQLATVAAEEIVAAARAEAASISAAAGVQSVAGTTDEVAARRFPGRTRPPHLLIEIALYCGVTRARRRRNDSPSPTPIAASPAIGDSLRPVAGSDAPAPLRAAGEPAALAAPLAPPAGPHAATLPLGRRRGGPASWSGMFCVGGSG